MRLTVWSLKVRRTLHNWVSQKRVGVKSHRYTLITRCIEEGSASLLMFEWPVNGYVGQIVGRQKVCQICLVEVIGSFSDPAYILLCPIERRVQLAERSRDVIITWLAYWPTVRDVRTEFRIVAVNCFTDKKYNSIILSAPLLAENNSWISSETKIISRLRANERDCWLEAKRNSMTYILVVTIPQNSVLGHLSSARAPFHRLHRQFLTFQRMHQKQ